MQASRSFKVFGCAVVLMMSHLQVQSINPVKDKVYPAFELDEVSLLDSEFKLRQDHDLKYLETLDPDMYLAHFRRNAGITTNSKGEAINNKNHYHGWEYGGSSTFGHYLSAISMMYKVTGDVALLEKINYIIDELDYIQHNPVYSDESLNKGVLVAYDRDDQDKVKEPNFLRTFDELRNGIVNLTTRSDDRNATATNPYYKTFYWLSGGLSWYTNHKIYAGIRDAYRYTGNEKAKDVFLYFCDWACWVTENLTDEQFGKMLYSEHGGMNEMLTEAYAMTGDTKYLTYAKKFNESETISPCIDGNMTRIATAISNTHANAQIPQFYGTLKEYEYTGETDFLNASKNFFKYVTEQQSFATGGNSEWEQFRTANSINAQITRRSGESCNTYNMLKIAKGLFEYTGDEIYADYCERALYNHILASINTNELGAFTYFLSLEPGYFKTFSRPYDAHWCCAGTGMENHAKYGEFIYFHTDKDIYVNLYVASELNWKDKSFKMTTETKFPYSENITYQIKESDGTSRAIYLRYPDWAKKGMTVTVNGQPIETSNVQRGSYIKIERNWAVNDKIEIVLPLTLWKEAVPGYSKRFAIFYGPVLLAGKLGTANMPESVLAGGENDYTKTTTYDYKGTLPVFTSNLAADKCLELTDASTLTFKSLATAPQNGIEFVPLYNIMNERYSVYWTVSTDMGIAPESGKKYRIRWAGSSDDSPLYMTLKRTDNEKKYISAEELTSADSKDVQVWQIEYLDDSGVFKIVNPQQTDSCMSVYVYRGAAVARDSSVIYTKFKATDYLYRWSLIQNNEGFSLLNYKYPEFAMDLFNYDQRIHTYESNKGDNQRFIFEEVTDETGIYSVRDDRSVNVVGKNGILYVSSMSGIRHIELFLLSGQKVQDISGNDQTSLQIPVSGQFYIVRIMTDQGIAVKKCLLR